MTTSVESFFAGLLEKLHDYPRVLAIRPRGATLEQLSEVEEHLEGTFPEEVRQLYLIQNGIGLAPNSGLCPWLSLEGGRWLLDYLRGERWFERWGIDSNRKLFPVTDGGNGDYWFIDIGDGPAKGQVYRVDHEDMSLKKVPYVETLPEWLEEECDDDGLANVEDSLEENPAD